MTFICDYCDAVTDFGKTRCNTETCYLRHIAELKSQLSAATARASELERELREAKMFIAWCQGYAGNTREVGTLRAKLAHLNPSLKVGE